MFAMFPIDTVPEDSLELEMSILIVVLFLSLRLFEALDIVT